MTAFELKSLHPDAIPAALEKARQYRVLNEPGEAESICLDILVAQPENDEARIVLLLALTDQFGSQLSTKFLEAKGLLERLSDEYERAYYSGVINERRAKAHLYRASPGSSHVAYEWFVEAMQEFEKAESVRPAGNDDAILRWNTCARFIMTRGLEPSPEERVQMMLE
ncbi:MAG: hypothetical protein O3B01_15810 [Planctomycetota bacterium]|nr:hypothetical protein [Planctomycetota bacterium]MDA1140041.1 hypothetical protein [Planctomycetota bacterium]